MQAHHRWQWTSVGLSVQRDLHRGVATTSLRTIGVPANRQQRDYGRLMAGPVELVLFDLGGVLIELRGVPAMRNLSGIVNDDELWHRWLTCRWVRSYETGQCSKEAFARGMVDDWGLSIRPTAFLEEFQSWPVGPMPGAEDLVREVLERVPVSCFSNTNELHWAGNAVHWPLVSMFQERFVSYEMGIAKPDREAFEHVAGALSAPPERVLFLDDNAANTESARTVGFRALRVSGVEEARSALVTTGVLPDANHPPT
jgi:glucose-1-phosphatase